MENSKIEICYIYYQIKNIKWKKDVTKQRLIAETTKETHTSFFPKTDSRCQRIYGYTD